MAHLPITLDVDGPAALAQRYYPNGRLGGLAVDGAAPGVLGQHVQLTVVVHKPSRAFSLRGQLAWVRHKAGPGKPMGFGVDFLPEDDAARVRLLAFARQEVQSDATRVEARHQVSFDVKLVHQGKPRRELVADLSTGGAFVRTWNPLPVGEQVQLYLRPRLSLMALELSGTVAWARYAGEHAGMGIEFHLDDERRQRLEKLVDRLT